MVSTKPTNVFFRYIDIDSIDNKRYCITSPKVIQSNEAPSRASRKLSSGDTLFSMVRPYLENIAYIDDFHADCIASTGFYVCKPNAFLSPKYCFRLMTSLYVIMGLNRYMKGDNSPSINNDNILSWLYPIPPLSEQQRIISTIEQYNDLSTDLEVNKEDLNQFITQTKSKILDLAIRGKLVPQDPNDEPASVLLERIKAERSDSKKKTKNTGDISHYPFEIPTNWIWVHGHECFNPMESKKPTGETFRYIDINSIDNKKHIISESKSIKVSQAPSRACRGLAMGDTLFSMVRPYLENIAFVEEIHKDSIASTGFFVCKPNQMLFPKYLYYLMLSSYVIDGLNVFMKGDNSPSINNDNITSFPYPIPPMKEQRRIVHKIEQISIFLDLVMEEMKAQI